MQIHLPVTRITAVLLFLIVFAACKNKGGRSDLPLLSLTDHKLAISNRVQSILDEAKGDKGKYFHADLLEEFYNENFSPKWNTNSWSAQSDSLLSFISDSRLYGLFPDDYHLDELQKRKRLYVADSTEKAERRDPEFWAETDLLFSDAFIGIVKDIKLGRLPTDSITMRKDSTLNTSFYITQFEKLSSASITAIVNDLEPLHKGYRELKACIRAFLDSADNRNYSIVPYPEKDKQRLQIALQRRLYEEGYLQSDSIRVDSSQLAAAIRRFQMAKGITADGRAGEGTIRAMNVNDRERFIRVAISLDKYKMLPPVMPAQYIWVNISANYLELFEKDSVRLFTKVICGRPKTRTPVLTSDITQLITYPQWVPPPSIVLKEILPAVKKDPGYLAKKGFSLVDSKGEEVDPYSVDWSKYSKGIPYRIVQGSGDANALGIMKFVFANKFSVYLHDTNQRYLFANSMRSLSHGCVRVQEWQKLAFYILRQDSLKAVNGNYTRIDSVRTWLAKKQKRTIPVRNTIPVFLRYITCEGKNGKLVFYDDVYAEDRMLREKYFASK